MAVTELENPIEGQPSLEKEGSVEKKGKKVSKSKKKKDKTSSAGEVAEDGELDISASARAPSMTPGPRSSRSHTPLSIYMQRKSEDPNALIKLRSITPFINRQSKEKTPFELGHDIHDQLIAHKMVIDRASVMDISDDHEYQPVRNITSDAAIVDRAAVMDVSNVEVIYMVEEYEDAEYEEHLKLAEDEAKKKKSKKGSRKSKSVSIVLSEDQRDEESPGQSVERDSPNPKTKAIRKKILKKREEGEEEYSPPSVQLPKLKLNLGGGPKFNKNLFESGGPDARPPVKRPPQPAAVNIPQQMEKPQPEQNVVEEKSQSREPSEFISDREQSEVPEEEYPVEAEYEEEEKEPTPELTEEELAALEEKRLEEERIEELRREWQENENRRLKALREQMAEVEKWNRIREEEGVEFMNKIKKFIQQKRNDPSHLCFVNHLPNIIAMEGQDCRVACSVNGTNLQIKWFKNGREIQDNGYKYKCNVSIYDIISLEILDCTKADSGEYKCEITSHGSKAISTCFISIQDISEWMEEPCKPNIDETEDNYNFANDELTIKCKVHGTPRPTVTFYRTDLSTKELFELKTSQKYLTQERSHNVFSLIIQQPTSSDTGIYVIKATNAKGEHMRQHIVEFFVSKDKVVY